MTLFVARAVAIITQNLRMPKSVSEDPVQIQEFQRDTLKRTQRPIISCPEITLAPGLEVTKDERARIRDLVKPAWRKYMDTCTEYVNLHRGTLNKVDHLRARTLIDIFSVAWTEIVLVYDEISKMILAERSARLHLNVSCIDWVSKQ
ncbi:MAG: hypothetical protein GY861_13275 [bacterium]|nr:hypothetical protein [bacterium]